MSGTAIALDRTASQHIDPAGADPADADPADPGPQPAARTRTITGLTPSGRLHIGNYLGALRPFTALVADPGNACLVFIAGLCALTTPHDPAARERTRELAATGWRAGWTRTSPCSCNRRCPRTRCSPSCWEARPRTGN